MEFKEGDLLYSAYKRKYGIVTWDESRLQWWVKPRDTRGDDISWSPLCDFQFLAVKVPLGKDGKIDVHWKRPTAYYFPCGHWALENARVCSTCAEFARTAPEREKRVKEQFAAFME